MLIVVVLSALAVALYWYLTRTFDYWRRRGVKHDRPWPLFGTNAKNYLLQASLLKMATDAYRNYPGEKLVGFYRSSRPELVIRDLALAKRVLINDFAHFHRRALFPGPPEPLAKNQLMADDDLWRLLRLRTTPAFSSGKLKAMFPLVVERTRRLQARLQGDARRARPVDARDLMARFTTDVIGTVAFGIVTDSLHDEDEAMRRFGQNIFKLNFSRLVNFSLKSLMPSAFGHLKFFSEVEGITVRMVREIMQQRNYEPIGRGDFIDLLLECKKQGAMTGESIVEVDADGSAKKVSIEMDDEIMAAQSFVFFAAGFETSSSATSYALHQLAHHPHIQRKAQDEIDRVLEKHDHELSYDAIAEMTYLRWCLDEALRLLPSVGFLQRQCVRSYTFPGTRVSIDPGVTVIIPVEAFQNDPAIFPEPSEFRPERFDPALLTAEQKMAYMPFGLGPRACVGERLGLMQSLAGLAAVLARSSVAPAPGAPRDPVVNKVSNLQSIVGGLPLIFHERSFKQQLT